MPRAGFGILAGLLPRRHQGYRKPGRKTKENDQKQQKPTKNKNQQKPTQRAAQGSKGPYRVVKGITGEESYAGRSECGLIFGHSLRLRPPRVRRCLRRENFRVRCHRTTVGKPMTTTRNPSTSMMKLRADLSRDRWIQNPEC